MISVVYEAEFLLDTKESDFRQYIPRVNTCFVLNHFQPNVQVLKHTFLNIQESKCCLESSENPDVGPVMAPNGITEVIHRRCVNEANLRLAIYIKTYHKYLRPEWPHIFV